MSTFVIFIALIVIGFIVAAVGKSAVQELVMYILVFAGIILMAVGAFGIFTLLS